MIEAFKASHFIFVYLVLLIFSLWIREEFATIFKRKSFVSFRALRITVIRLLLQKSGLGAVNSKRTFQNVFLMILAFTPALFLPLSDRFDVLGNEASLGIISVDNSLTYIFCFLIIFEVSRSVINQEISGLCKRVPALFIVYFSLVLMGPSLSLEQMVQYQKSFGDLGLRNYLLVINPVGALFLAYLIVDELSNPRDDFELVDHLSLNGYILIFIYCFLGGYGLPSILEKQNIVPGMFTLTMQTLSLCAKFVFSIIIFWVFRYSSIRSTRRIKSGA
jgi:hypothetical protein